MKEESSSLLRERVMEIQSHLLDVEEELINVIQYI